MGMDVNPEIKDFWRSRATNKGLKKEEVTNSDIWQRWLEIETIKKYLRPEDRVLDVGCGNGYTTMAIAGEVREIIGVDFCAEMIEQAEATAGGSSLEGVSFAVQDVLQLDESKFGLFDVAVSERCLINLDSEEKQRRGIENIASVLKKGGRFIFIEGCRDGRAGLNDLRVKTGLESMPAVWHNLDFDETETVEFLRKHFELKERISFGVYDFITRVLHPLLVAPEQPKYDAAINQLAARLSLLRQEFKDLSRVLFLILEKK